MGGKGNGTGGSYPLPPLAPPMLITLRSHSYYKIASAQREKEQLSTTRRRRRRKQRIISFFGLIRPMCCIADNYENNPIYFKSTEIYHFKTLSTYSSLR